MTTAISLTLMALCLLLSAYFSATETAFSSLSTDPNAQPGGAGDRRAALALRLRQQYDRLISTILIGNNIVNIAAASLGTLLFVRLLRRRCGAHRLHRGDDAWWC